MAQELCHVEADDEDNDGLVEGGLSVVHDLRDLIADCSDVLQTSQTTSKIATGIPAYSSARERVRTRNWAPGGAACTPGVHFN